MDEIFVSPLQLTGIRVGDFVPRRAIVTGPVPALSRILIGPLLAALPGIWFLIEGYRKFRAWHAPAPVPAEEKTGKEP